MLPDSSRKIFNSITVNPADDGDEIRHKTGNFTFDQGRVAQNDVNFMLGIRRVGLRDDCNEELQNAKNTLFILCVSHGA